MEYGEIKTTTNLLHHASLSKIEQTCHAGGIPFHLYRKNIPTVLHFPQNHSPSGQFSVHPYVQHLADDEIASMPSLSWILPYLSPCKWGKLINIIRLEGGRGGGLREEQAQAGLQIQFIIYLELQSNILYTFKEVDSPIIVHIKHFKCHRKAWFRDTE